MNHYYVYFIDEEWGPGFLKICGYAPYTLKLCLNGHEWAKRQLTKQRDRLHGAGQRLPTLRRPGRAAGDLRPAGAGRLPGLPGSLAASACRCR